MAKLNSFQIIEIKGVLMNASQNVCEQSKPLLGKNSFTNADLEQIADKYIEQVISCLESRRAETLNIPESRSISKVEVPKKEHLKKHLSPKDLTQILHNNSLWPLNFHSLFTDAIIASLFKTASK